MSRDEHSLGYHFSLTHSWSMPKRRLNITLGSTSRQTITLGPTSLNCTKLTTKLRQLQEVLRSSKTSTEQLCALLTHQTASVRQCVRPFLLGRLLL